MTGEVRVVHVVAKTHLDLGFTALAAEVEQQYLTDFFPRAVRAAQELRGRGGSERLVWTTGSWILHRALAAEDAAGEGSPLAEAVARGDLAWHAWPFTTHTELLDVPLAEAALRFSQDLDARFGRPPTTAAKQTDVPGHTRGLVPILARAGVTFLHIGVNPAWPVPDVPPAFRWRSPDGSEITVAYQRGGYGGEVVVPGCDEALAFLHAGDNLGPPSADDVVTAHAELRDRFPGAELRAGTLDAFARALAASGAEADLPVVTAEIGDPWIFGCASDPQKLAALRAELRGERRGDLLRVVEHTWGLDQKIGLAADLPWDARTLEDIRRTDAGRRFEASWREQRSYLDVRTFEEEEDLPLPTHLDGGLLDLEEPVTWGPWELRLDSRTGAVAHLLHRPSGRLLAESDHRLAELVYETFDEVSYERFYADLTPVPDDEWWARLDNTKPGIDAAGAVAASRLALLSGARRDGPHAIWVESDPSVRGGAPPLAIRTRWEWHPGEEDQLGCTVWWSDKAASRLPEAMWCAFVPLVAEPERWTMDKLGQDVSPLDVVRQGGRALHAVGRGMTYDGPEGRLWIDTDDAALVAPGAPRLLDADPPLPDMAGGWHVLLFDNCWGTNFPMWIEGPASFTFRIGVGPRSLR